MTTTPETPEQIVYEILKGYGMLDGTRASASQKIVDVLRAAGLLRARLELTTDGYLLADPVADTIARVVGIPCNWQQVQDIAAAFRAEGLLVDAPTEEQIERVHSALVSARKATGDYGVVHKSHVRTALAAAGVTPRAHAKPVATSAERDKNQADSSHVCGMHCEGFETGLAPQEPSGCSNPECPLGRAHSGPCAPEGWSPDREKLIAEARRRYPTEHGRRAFIAGFEAGAAAG